MAKILALNGLIHGKYESQAQLANVLGWPRQRLNKIVNGDKEPDLDEVKALIRETLCQGEWRLTEEEIGVIEELKIEN